MGTPLNVAQEDTGDFVLPKFLNSWHESVIMPFMGHTWN